jgi:hypothetical protein
MRNYQMTAAPHDAADEDDSLNDETRDRATGLDQDAHSSC